MLLPAVGYGQVTIGMDEKPMNGALLQLKTEKDQDSRGGFNAIKGLALPRVSMTTTTPAANQLAQSIGSAGAWDKDLHVGMLVYNVNECVIGGQRGLYVWSGSEWQSLFRGSSDILTFQDQEGGSFRARQFGNAGVWMLDNLAVKSFADGTPLSVHAGLNNSTVATYAYPNAVTTNWSAIPSTWDRTQGLLYNWPAATNNYAPGNINQAQVAGETPGPNEVENRGTGGVAPLKYVQGICPNGWHVPSDREWNRLEREIANNPTKYSTNTGTGWNDGTVSGAVPATNWALFTGYRGNTGTGAGYGSSIKSSCIPTGSSIATGGRSLRPSQGGFSSLLVGDVVATAANSYGTWGFFWTSSQSSSVDLRGWVRWMQNDNAGVQRNNLNMYFLLSVRCKQNES